MTNAEKYLKNGVNVGKLATEFQKWCIINNNVDTQTYYNELAGFLSEPFIPTLTKDERDELKRLCKKVLLSFQDEPQMIELFENNDRFDYHESTNTFDLEIYIRKRELTVDEMLKREPPKNYGTMELFE